MKFNPEYEWDDRERPLAYLITFRTYGTWLHGDARLSVDQHDDKNIFGGSKLPSNERLESVMRSNMRSAEFVLDIPQREAVTAAITEVCEHRGYILHALNVRSNHAHAVVSGQDAPEKIADDLKRYSTRRLRELGLLDPTQTPWSRGRSRRYLWKPANVAHAIEYVLYSQGDIPYDPAD